MTRAYIDQYKTLPGESRCQHDMLAGTCAICKGLPEVPELSPLDIPNLDERPRSRPFKAERSGRCVRCGRSYRMDERIVWSELDEGVLGPCCMREGA